MAEQASLARQSALLYCPSVNPATLHAAEESAGVTVTKNLPTEDECAPKDTVRDCATDQRALYHTTQQQLYAAYWLYVLLGLGVLYPWQAFLSSLDFYFAVYPDRNIDRMCVYPVHTLSHTTHLLL